MALPAHVRDRILAAVERVIDGPGVGYVKVRIAGGRVKRLFTNVSEDPGAEALTCPEDGAVLTPERPGPGDERRFVCSTCRMRWPESQLRRRREKSLAGGPAGGSVRLT